MHKDFSGMPIAAEGMLAVSLVIERFKDIIFNEPPGMHELEELVRFNRQILAENPEDLGAPLALQERFFDPRHG